MSVGPPNVSFVPRERLMILAPRSAAQRIASEVLKEDPWPFDPRARTGMTLTWAVPAIHCPLSVTAAITPETPGMKGARSARTAATATTRRPVEERAGGDKGGDLAERGFQARI